MTASPLTRRVLAGALVGFGAAALVLGSDLVLTSFTDGGVQLLQAIELRTYDWRLERTAKPDLALKNIAIVDIDEYSLRNLQPNAGRWPWPRIVHAVLIDYLASAPAKVIAYDINFAEPDDRIGFAFGESVVSGAESDAAMAESIEVAGNVILLADATFGGEAAAVAPLDDVGYQLDRAGVTERKVVFPPFNTLAQAAAGLGHNLFILDPDGPIRHFVPFVRSGPGAIPLLGMAVALRVAGIPPASVRLDGTTLWVGEDRAIPLEWREVASSEGTERYLWGLINFRGPALLDDLTSRTYPAYSFFDLLYSQEQILAGQKPDIDPAEFRDKIVFVGTTASGLFDVFETPFSHGQMPGSQIHAAVADQILSGRFLRPASTSFRLASVSVAGLAVGILATTVPAGWATLAAVVFVWVFGWTATSMFANGVWVNVSQPILGSAFALFGGVAYQYAVESREKRQMKKLFGQYVSKDIYDQLVANPERARLGGHRREMTVLFSDIRGFTTMSEQGRPEDVVNTLNEYFTRMVDIVFHHKGTLDKFVGDMVMALFGAPLDDSLHADHAVETALDMVEALHVLNLQWAAEGRPLLDIGIGINSGPMIAGNIGSNTIMSYTVVGDAVNLAARLESLNRQYGTHIIISENTRSLLTKTYPLKPLGEVVVKGKTQPVAIFEILATIDPLPLTESQSDAVDAAIDRDEVQP